MEDQLREIEKKDGIRLPFNVLPTKPSDTLPTAVLYTPCQPGPVLLPYEPVFCITCRAILNPFTDIDHTHKTWTCIFCKKTNGLPEHYRDIQPDSLPLELYDTTVEYKLTRECSPVMYVFVIDVCSFDDQRHVLMQDAVKQAFDLLDSESLVCFVLFGTNVELLCNTNDEISRSYLYSAKKAYTREDLHRIFKMTATKTQTFAATGTQAGAYKSQYMNQQLNTNTLVNKFFAKKSDVTLDIPGVFHRDRFPVSSGQRPLRCTGAALSFAASIVDVSDSGTKVLLFTQGPCTFGPGTITSLSLRDGIRSHTDIVKGKASYVKPAIQFYTEIATRLANDGHALDIIAATIEDVGVYEMRVLVDMTGGVIIMAQDFDRKIYLESIQKNFTRKDESSNENVNEGDDANIIVRSETAFALNGKIRVTTSPNIVFKGVLGQGTSFASGWRVGSLYPHTNLSILFEPVRAKSEELAYIQIATQVQQGKGLTTRVTTLARMFNDATEKIALGFDQEAGCVLQARIYTSMNKFEEDIDLVRRIDRGLIRFVKKFAGYSRDDAASVSLPESMQFYPNFMYFLRRSVVVQSEHNSADETSYFRSVLGGQRVTEAMTMVVPTLIQYHYSEGVGPVEMDTKSMRPDTILLLDAFVNVLVWKGEHVAEWIDQGLHEKEEYVSLKECIEESLCRAREICRARLQTPRFVETKAGGSQERILMSRVNPSRQGAEIVTEDIDFETFYRCLCKIVVEA